MVVVRRKPEMEVVPLEPAYEPIFWEHVSQDIPHHYFFAFDWKYNRDETKILLALRGNRIDGMMLMYRKYIVQLRGSEEAARALLERLDLEKVELQALEEHEQCVLERYKPTITHKMMLMLLQRGEERPQIKHPIVKLDASDAEEIAAIMKDADPEFWGTMTSQQTVEGMSRGVNWFGIRVNEDLASTSSMRLTEWGGLIGVVATHAAHRNKGYATSTVSHSVKQILERKPTVLIYVFADNTPAIRVYGKVGFKPYRTYFFMRGEKR